MKKKLKFSAPVKLKINSLACFSARVDSSLRKKIAWFLCSADVVREHSCRRAALFLNEREHFRCNNRISVNVREHFTIPSIHFN